MHGGGGSGGGGNWASKLLLVLILAYIVLTGLRVIGHWRREFAFHMQINDAPIHPKRKREVEMEAAETSRPDAHEPRCFWGPGDRYTFLVTGDESSGSMFALDCVVGAGGGPPPHRHLAEDELFYVFDGSVSFTMGDETRVIRPGESAFVPRGTKHTYVNESEKDARMIAVYTPAGMEGWFREVCTPADESGSPPPVTPELIERMVAAGPRYNIDWVQ